MPVRWAPASLPVERRLQTASILFGIVVFPLMLSLLAALLVWPPLVRWYSRELMAVYVVAMLIDKAPVRGGRASLWVRNWAVWRHASNYFPAELHVPAGGYDASKPHLLCAHPHGIISTSVIANLIWNAKNHPVERVGLNYRCATVTFNFSLPIWRELIMGLGFVSASKASIKWLLDHGMSALIVIGGAQETLHAKPGAADLVLNKRKGFIKMALRTGASLVPIYHFGETELYDQVENPLLRKLQLWCIRLTGFTIPLVRGRGIFQYSYGLLPRRHELHTVMGPAIPVEKVADPTPEQVDAVHAKYIAALQALYNEHKDKYAHPTTFDGQPLQPPPLKLVA